MSIWRDFRFAARVLIKDKWFVLAAVVALGLGIAVNMTVFTLVNAVLLRGLPFEEPDRIVALRTQDSQGRNLVVSQPDFDDIADTATSFEGIAFIQGGNFNLSDDDAVPERYEGFYISANVFDFLRVQPMLGRGFLPEDDEADAPAVAMISHRLWAGRYGSDPSIIGRTIRLYTLQATVVGVMPEGMLFPINTDIWVPTSQLSPGLRNDNRGVRTSPTFGRLAEGVSLDQANAEMGTLSARLAAEYPDTNDGMVIRVVPFTEFILGPQVRLIFWALMGAVVFVLLIACANVANLLLVRSARRVREVSVRTVLGATRWRIVRQLLAESVLMAAGAGVLGLALSIVGVRLASLAFAEVGVPFWMQFTMDFSVFAFLAAMCLGTGILFGLVPALQVSRADVSEVLKQTGGRSGTVGRSARRWTSALVTAELAVTMVLLAGGGYMARSFLVLYQLDFGVDTESLMTAQMVVTSQQYPDADARAAFFEQAEARLSQHAAIQSVTFTTNPPLSGGGTRSVSVEGREPLPDELAPTVTILAVGGTYFETLGLGLVRGRGFTPQDGTEGYENVIVNQRFASLHFPGEDPIGRRMRFIDENADPLPAWQTIVGVAPIVRQRDLEDIQPDPIVYLPYRAYTQNANFMIVRSRSSDPSSLTNLLRDELQVIAPVLALFNIRTMDELLADRRWPTRVFASMFGIFALIALVLSAVGLYSVTAYAVNRRRGEIGIRMALGAQSKQIGWLIGRAAAIQLAIGLALGLAGGAAVGQLLESWLVQIGPNDPITLVLIGAVLVTVAGVASLVPSLRASRLDPVDALRYE